MVLEEEPFVDSGKNNDFTKKNQEMSLAFAKSCIEKNNGGGHGFILQDQPEQEYYRNTLM